MVARQAAAACLLTLLMVTALTHFAYVSAASTPLPAVPARDSSPLKRFLIYYGWLNTSNVEELSVDVIVVAGTSRILPGGADNPVVTALRQGGAEVFAYLTDDNDTPVGLGSSFREAVVDNQTGTLDDRLSYWLSEIESFIDKYEGVVDGVFFDECDPGYFTDNLSDPLVGNFSQALSTLVDYAHNESLLVMINGVMGYAGYGDYYLWEDFVSYYDPANGSYRLVPDFLKETQYQSPLEWVNGLSRYEYLRDNGLLNRTFAITQYDPNNSSTLPWVEGGHALAAIMGVAGWGYADGHYYAGGGPVPLLPVFEYGPGVVDGVINSSSGTAEGYFLEAVTTFYDSSGSASTDYLYPIVVHYLDGDPAEYSWPRPSSPVLGQSSQIDDLGIDYTTAGLFIYVNASFDTTPSGVVAHAYVDDDGDASTGFSVSTPNGTIGADHLIEVYDDGTAAIYNYTGSGSDWSWVQWRSLPTYYSQVSGRVVVELQAPGLVLKLGSSRVAVATVVSYADDAVAGYYVISDRRVETPTYYEDTSQLSGVAGLVQGYVMEGSSDMVVYVSGPVGEDINYTFLTPFEDVTGVYHSGQAVQYVAKQAGYGTLVSVVVQPTGSSDSIEVQGTPSPLPEPGLLVAVTAVATALALVARRRGRP